MDKQLLIRGERKKVIIFYYKNNITININESKYNEIINWINYDIKSDYIDNLSSYIGEQFLEALKVNKDYFLTEAEKSLTLTSPMKSYVAPTNMNIELTTRCPLRCPQCYCDLNRGKDINIDIAKKYIEQASNLKIPYINLSGGETMVYPHLLELIKACSEYGLYSSIAISGYGFNSYVLDKLINAGIGDIYVSLNGSNSKINSLTRDGFDLAIKTLEVLKNSKFKRYYINWVAHENNITDISNMVDLAKSYNVSKLIIISFKPDSNYELKSVPSKEKFLYLANYIKKFKDNKLDIIIESCYSQLRAYVMNGYLFNANIGIEKGCGAARDGISIDVDGNLTPCRHLEYHEKYEKINDYWNKSSILNEIRNAENNVSEKCYNCKYSNNCLPCIAINSKLENKICKNNSYCPLGN